MKGMAEPSGARKRMVIVVALLAALVSSLVLLGCAGVVQEADTPESLRPAAGAVDSSATAASIATSGSPRIVGVSDGDLVIFDAASGSNSVLVPGVGSGWPLLLQKGGDWIGILSPGRWDGAYSQDIEFVNLRSKQVRDVADIMGQGDGFDQVQPVGWAGDGFVFTVYDPELEGDWVLDLASGTTKRAPKGQRSDGYAVFSQTDTWKGSMKVPTPPGEASRADAQQPFWHWGDLDVSQDERWAVGSLNADWPAPGVDDFHPVYLFARDGTYRSLPLSPPVVFAETLGAE